MLNQLSEGSEGAPAGDELTSLLSMRTGRAQRDTYHVVKSELNRLISELATGGEPRLPSEEDLSARLEVSRATIRSALLSLQKDGVIQRVHGRGTFINRHALHVPANISQDRPFADLLAELGHDVVVRSDDIRIEPGSATVLQALELTDAQDGCVIRRVFEVSGAPAAYCIDFVPTSLLQVDVAAVDGRDSIFEFIRRYAKHPIRYSVAEIVPVIPTEEIVETLRVPEDRAVMLLQHTHIDETDRPVAFTRAYVNDQFLRFSVVRTYTDC